jgi:outer membrane receptor protein involved in Fe transport
MKYSPIRNTADLPYALAGFLVLTALPLTNYGQTSDDPTVFDLSPFEVNTSTDRGYTATSSLMGGRLATELRDTAATVSVFTEEFLEDIAVNNFLEAAKWAPNSVPQEEIDSGNLYNDYTVSFRGLGRGFQSRNYFRWYLNSDTYSTERIEFARGPNSLVFGDAGVGGVANVSSKQARGTDLTSLEGQWSSFGGFRILADADQKLTDWASVRIAAVHQDFDSWKDVGYEKFKGAFLTTTLRPADGTTIRAEVELAERKRLITFNTLEQLADWDGVTTNPGFIGRRDPVPNSLSKFTSPRLVFNSARPDLGILDLEGYATTTGTFGQGLKTKPQEGLPDFAVIPGGSYEFSLQAPNGGVDNPFWTTSLFLEQRILKNLFAEVAANYQYQERDITRWFFDQLLVDVNETLPNGDVNPYLGELYGWARYWDNTQSNEVMVVRGSLAYILETSLTDQRFLLVAGHREDRFEDHNWQIVRTNGRTPDVRVGENRIYARRYVSDGSIPVLTPPSTDPVSGIESRRVKTSGFFSEKPITYYQAAVSGKWFNDRSLNTLFGIRRDNYEEKLNDASLDDVDPVTKEFLGFGPAIRTDKQEVTSYTASGVYHFNDTISLSAAYSESFDPGSTARSINGTSLEPLINNGLELGLRLALMESRIIASATYYDSEQENNRIGGESSAINGIWGILNLTEREVQTGYSDRQTNEGDGWEFEVTAMPTDNWRVLFNISFPETAISDGFSDTRAYFNDNVAFWRAEASRLEAAGDPGSANSIRTRIDSIEAAIESVTRGRELDGSFRYTANLFTRYFFTEGRLQGLSVGGGVNLRGDRLVGNEPGDPFDYIYADGYSLVSLLVGYERPLGSGDLSVQLNVTNLLDDEIVRQGSASGSGYGFTVQDPREFLLTIRYNF